MYSNYASYLYYLYIFSESALLPLTNLKRRMSDVEDAKDEVFQPSSTRPSLVKQEFGVRPRSIKEDEPFQAQSRNPFVAQTTNYKTPARSLAASFAQSSTRPSPMPITTPESLPGLTPESSLQYMTAYGGFGEEMRKNYNNFVMENNLVVWVTKWVDYSNRYCNEFTPFEE